MAEVQRLNAAGVMGQTSATAKRSPVKAGIVGSILPVAKLPTTGLKFLLFGPSGTGKSTLACTFPKPLLFVRPEQVEDGSLSIRLVPDVFSPRQLEDPDELDELCEHAVGKYATVVLDGVTKYQDLVLRKVLGVKDVPAQMSWGVAQQEDWGMVASEFKEHVRRMLRLTRHGVNVVVLGGERSIGGAADASAFAPTVMVALQPSSMGWMHEVCDYNVRTFIRPREEVKTFVHGHGKQAKTVKRLVKVPGRYDHCALTGPSDVYQTKFRVPKGTPLPEFVVDPDHDKFMRLVRGEAL